MQWQEGFELILRSVIQMARLVTPIMRDQGSGCIVNLSSYAAVRPELERPVSPVFRAGLSAWTRILEIGKVVAFLLSPEASYMTGQNLLVDGGMVRTL